MFNLYAWKIVSDLAGWRAVYGGFYFRLRIKASNSLMNYSMWTYLMAYLIVMKYLDLMINE